MPTALIGGAISGGSSLIGGILGHNAASDAAKAQAAAAQKAAEFQQQQQASAIAAQEQATKAQTANQQPFIGAGQNSINSLQQLLQPGGQLTQGYQDFTAPTGVTEQNDPGYAFRLQQGQNALQNSAAARGGLLSSGTAKTLSDYNQNAASAEYGNVYGRALQTYGANQNNFNTNNTNLYNRLYGVAGLGENAASNLNSNLQAGAQNEGNIDMTTGQLVGNDYTGAGNAKAGGIVGGSNALTGGISGAGNAVNQGLTLQQLLGAQNASSGNSDIVTRTPTVAGYDPSYS